MQRIAYPFLRLSDDQARLDEWQYRFGNSDELVTAGASIAGWDYQQNFAFERTVAVDWEQAANVLDIPAEDLDLALFVRVGTGNTTLPRAWIATYRFALERSGEAIHVAIDVPGDKLSGKLFLSTSIVLMKTSKRAGDLSPVMPAACLWQDQLVVVLEDDESRFPMEAVPFSTLMGLGVGNESPWYLNYSAGSPHRDFTSAARLFVNTENREFFKLIDKLDRMALQQMLGHVMVTIARDVILDDEVESFDVFASGSVGRYVASWMDLAFPGTSLASVKSILNTSPGRFSAALLAVADPGDAE